MEGVVVRDGFPGPPDAPPVGTPLSFVCALCGSFEVRALPGEVPPPCEYCLGTVPAAWRLKAGESKVKENPEEVDRQAEFFERVERLLGNRSWEEGDRAGVKCQTCGREYVWGKEMALVHAQPGCSGIKNR